MVNKINFKVPSKTITSETQVPPLTKEFNLLKKMICLQKKTFMEMRPLLCLTHHRSTLVLMS